MLIVSPRCARRPATSLGVFGDYAEEVLADEPIMYCPLGEPSGAQAVDLSGFGNHGTITGTFIQGAQRAANIIGGSLNFSSSTAVVTFSDTPFQFPGLLPFTFETWINGATSGNAFGRIWTKGTGAPQCTANFTTGSGTSFYGRGGTALQVASLNLRGGWNHHVWTYDGATQRVYVNGILRGSLADTFSMTAGSGSTMRLGESGQNMAGLIGHAAVYRRALSESRVQSHYRAGYGLTMMRIPVASTGGILFPHNMTGNMQELTGSAAA